MNNTFSPRSTTGPLRRSKGPGESEFNALFQLFPGPALLVDMSRELIALANSAFFQLTAFAIQEVIGRPLRDLVGDLPSHSIAVDETLTVTLERRNRPCLTVSVQSRRLDAAGQWLALLFEEEDPQKQFLSRIERVVRALEDFHQAPLDEPIRESMTRVLKAAAALLDVSTIALYRQGSEDRVWKIAETGAEDQRLLPGELPSADLSRLAETVLWRPGRRVQMELHRAARVQNFSYMVSTPLERNGLLVVADQRGDPPFYMTTLVEAIGRHLSARLGTMALISSLRRQVVENRRELVILRAVGDNAQDGVLLLAPDLTVSEMNPAAEWMLGYASWEVKGQPVENILIGPERLAPALEMACEGLPTHNMGNVSLHRRNGQAFPAHIQVVPIQREGETLAILISFSDVSEHVEIRNRTQQLEQRAVLGEVTAVFAHEVRNPINNISTGLQLLSVKLPPNDTNQDNIQRLLNDCQRLNHLMESVLNFSRQAEHHFEEVNLDIFLNRLLDRWRPRMTRVNVTSYFQIEPDTAHVLADPRSLEQVFTNLVGNAVEAMSSKGGTLAVRVAPFHLLPGRPQVEITVSDNGPGIPDEVRERIFEPFVTTKQQGTGLGLAITKRIVTAHHGSISVNTFPGGTVFHVILPAYQGENA